MSENRTPTSPTTTPSSAQAPPRRGRRRIIKRLVSTFAVLAILLVGLAAVGLVASRPAPVDTASPVGLRQATFVDEDRSRDLAVSIWYPTEATGTVELFEDNLAFRGYSAIAEAEPADGTFPLIVLSHGSGGNQSNQAWLAVELAREGAIVVAPNHPGSTSGDSAASTNIHTWNRPQDVSTVIDHMLADDTFGPRVDDSRIAVVGHSLGGYTALASVGGTLSLDRFIEYCDTYTDSPDCTFYREGEVDLTAVDRDRFEGDHRDERIRTAVIIDPAYARSFDPDSLATVPDTLLIAATAEQGSSSDLHAGYLAEQLGDSTTFVEIESAQHFSFIAECKPTGYFLLLAVEPGGQVLCAGEDGRSRAEIHDETTRTVITYLEEQDIL